MPAEKELVSRRERLEAVKNSLSRKIRECDHKIEILKSVPKGVLSWESSDSESEVCLAVQSTDAEAARCVESLQTRLLATRELRLLEHLDVHVEALEQRPDGLEFLPDEETEPGKWRRVSAKGKIDSVPFIVSFHLYENQKSSYYYRNVATELPKRLQSRELSRSGLHACESPALAVETVYRFARGYSHRRAVIGELARYSHQRALALRTAEETGARELVCSDFICIEWRLDCVPLRQCRHRFNFQILRDELMDDELFVFLKKAQQKLKEPDMSINTRKKVLSRIIEVCYERVRETMSDWSDIESIVKRNMDEICERNGGESGINDRGNNNDNNQIENVAEKDNKKDRKRPNANTEPQQNGVIKKKKENIDSNKISENKTENKVKVIKESNKEIKKTSKDARSQKDDIAKAKNHHPKSVQDKEMESNNKENKIIEKRKTEKIESGSKLKNSNKLKEAEKICPQIKVQEPSEKNSKDETKKNSGKTENTNDAKKKETKAQSNELEKKSTRTIPTHNPSQKTSENKKVISDKPENTKSIKNKEQTKPNENKPKEDTNNSNKENEVVTTKENQMLTETYHQVELKNKEAINSGKRSVHVVEKDTTLVTTLDKNSTKYDNKTFSRYPSLFHNDVPLSPIQKLPPLSNDLDDDNGPKQKIAELNGVRKKINGVTNAANLKNAKDNGDAKLTKTQKSQSGVDKTQKKTIDATKTKVKQGQTENQIVKKKNGLTNTNVAGDKEKPKIERKDDKTTKTIEKVRIESNKNEIKKKTMHPKEHASTKSAIPKDYKKKLQTANEKTIKAENVQKTIKDKKVANEINSKDKLKLKQNNKKSETNKQTMNKLKSLQQIMSKISKPIEKTTFNTNHLKKPTFKPKSSIPVPGKTSLRPSLTDKRKMSTSRESLPTKIPKILPAYRQMSFKTSVPMRTSPRAIPKASIEQRKSFWSTHKT